MDERGERAAAVEAARKDALRRAKTGRRWTREAEDIFFMELALTANVKHSVDAAGMTDRAAYSRRKTHPAFAARWLEALDEGYAALELLMLRHSLKGAERTETFSGADGKVRHKKSVHSFPHGVAMRLIQSHRETVERYRAMAAAREDDDPAATALIREELDRVRARLRADAGGNARGEDGADG